jgi:hypothetical protein
VNISAISESQIHLREVERVVAEIERVDDARHHQPDNQHERQREAIQEHMRHAMALEGPQHIPATRSPVSMRREIS